jgi:membrane protease YdiL (CAAX protease family)
MKPALTYIITSSLLALAWHTPIQHGLWLVNAAAAMCGIAMAHTAARHGLLDCVSWRALCAGAVGGVGLVGITHALAHLILPRWHALALETRRLYSMIDDARGSATALLVILLVVVTEELVYRGLVTTELLKRLRLPAAVCCSVLLYALPLAASGSWVLVAIGVTLGTFWTLARIWSDGLVVSLVSHAIWSAATFVVLPLDLNSPEYLVH